MEEKSRVSIVKCDSYNKEILEKAIEKCINLLGGFNKFIKPNSEIVIKPNLLMAASPKSAVITHPLFIESVIEKIIKITKNSENITIADSPGAGIPYNKNSLERVYEKSGLKDVARKTGCRLNYNTGYSSLSYKEGKLIKKIEIINPVLGADIIINLPKFKTHNLTIITGAVKNMFGVIPGFIKPGYHMRFNEVGKFSEMMLDIVSYIKPTLNLMDGIVGMEGDGPGMSGSPRKIGLILASNDPISLDAVVTRLMGIREEYCPIMVAAKNRGIKSADIDNIEVVGEKLEDINISDFKFPKNIGREYLVKNNFVKTHILPFVRNSLNPYPDVNHSKCDACRTCIRVCPESSITVNNNNKICFDYNKCIRCFCCGEMCPQGAIETKYSFIGNLILERLGWGGKLNK